MSLDPALRQRIDGLGVLRDPDRPILRQAHETASLSDALQRRAERGEPVVVAKANMRSRVHRRVHMDYVSVLRYGDDGRRCERKKSAHRFGNGFDHEIPLC